MAVFFMPTTKTTQLSALASVALLDAYTDFILSRQAMNCTPITMSFYRFTAGKFLEWIAGQNITTPDEVTARHVRQFIAELTGRGLQDTTVHGYARAIKTLLRFWLNEGYITQQVRFEMPKLSKKRLSVLTSDQVKQIAQACNVRDKAIFLFMVDSGLRRAEVCALNWSDVDMSNGLVRVRLGKGQKDRSAAIGATTRRALLAYRRTLATHEGALFKTQTGTRLQGCTVLNIFRRLSKRTGIHITPHSLRRTFVILSLRAGMPAHQVQLMMGHTSLQMTLHYAQLEDIDLLEAHKLHSPVDNL
jgi:site-specific recombinase XerD